ncbi:MAG: 3D domain-containing protein [Chthoniobacterales bacterium]
MKTLDVLKFAFVTFVTCLFCSCATQTKITLKGPVSNRVKNVRTTAYTHTEAGGACNAVGARLSGGGIISAASDWSRFPLGTRFRIVGTNDEYIIDDYGGALIGTSTIDLYKTSRLAMRNWGVRHVDIDILRWGSNEESLKVLRPRSHNGIVRRMIAKLETKKT